MALHSHPLQESWKEGLSSRLVDVVCTYCVIYLFMKDRTEVMT